jgi:hypothetical protein
VEDADATENAVAEHVGWVAIEAARLEYFAGWLEVTLLCSTSAHPVVAGQGWTATHQACVTLHKKRFDSAVAKGAPQTEIALYEGILGTLQAADARMADRAQIVHSLWGLGGGLDTTLYKRWDRVRYSAWGADDLADRRTRLRSVTHEVVDAVDEFDALARSHPLSP